MTPLPKRRLSTRRQGNREKALKIGIKKAIHCPNCQALIFPHHLCKTCGFYAGHEVIVKKEAKQNKTKK